MTCRGAAARGGPAHGSGRGFRRPHGLRRGGETRDRSARAGRRADGRDAAARCGGRGRGPFACRAPPSGRSVLPGLRYRRVRRHSAARRWVRRVASIGSSRDGGGGSARGTAMPGRRMRGAACGGTVRRAFRRNGRSGSSRGRAGARRPPPPPPSAVPLPRERGRIADATSEGDTVTAMPKRRRSGSGETGMALRGRAGGRVTVRPARRR